MNPVDVLYISSTSPTGLRWACSRGRSVKAHDVAGSHSLAGYYKLTYLKRTYLAHRVVGVLCGILAGMEDPRMVDHIDGNKTNNNPENLRVVDNRHNQLNRASHRAGRLVGCSFSKAGRWVAQIRLQGKHVYLGSFATEQLAHEAYMQEYENKVAKPVKLAGPALDSQDVEVVA